MIYNLNLFRKKTVEQYSRPEYENDSYTYLFKSNEKVTRSYFDYG